MDWISHALVGAVAAIAGVWAHRAWARRRFWRRCSASTTGGTTTTRKMKNHPEGAMTSAKDNGNRVPPVPR